VTYHKIQVHLKHKCWKSWQESDLLRDLRKDTWMKPPQSEATDQDFQNAGREITELTTLIYPICVYNLRRGRRHFFKGNRIWSIPLISAEYLACRIFRNCHEIRQVEYFSIAEEYKNWKSCKLSFFSQELPRSHWKTVHNLIGKTDWPVNKSKSQAERENSQIPRVESIVKEWAHHETSRGHVL
jgi:hypothetical protein